MLYAVIYDLKNEMKDYSGLYTRIKEFGKWMHYIETLWIIKSEDSAQSIYEVLVPFIDKKTDYILVYELGDSGQGWFPKRAWDWIKENQKEEPPGDSGDKTLIIIEEEV